MYIFEIPRVLLFMVSLDLAWFKLIDAVVMLP